MKYRPAEEVEKGRSRDPIAVCRQRLIELGYLTGEEATSFMAEGKSATEATNEDFPPEVVAYLNKGIEAAIASPLPAAEEGAMWVFKENN
jgi:TPP-dependent pyruvate/acetoin dehydrogenase alpha subunit